MKMVTINANALVAAPEGCDPYTEELERGIAKFRAQSSHPINALIANQIEGLLIIAEQHPDSVVEPAIYNAIAALFEELELI
jgi:hypothetical protein